MSLLSSLPRLQIWCMQRPSDCWAKKYNALDLPTAGQVVPNHATLAVSHFIRAHLLGRGVTIENHQDLVAMKARLDYQYPNQEDTNMWVWGLQETYNLEQ